MLLRSLFKIRYAIADFLIGLGLFALLLSGVGSTESPNAAWLGAPAGPVAQGSASEAPAAVSPSAGEDHTRDQPVPEAVPAKPVVRSRPAALTTLGIVFAALFAFNLALVRHLRHAYAAPRARKRNEKRAR
jgi:hypothetical protein